MTALARGEQVEGRSKPHHLTAAAVALALSLIIHLVFWQEFPGLPLPDGKNPEKKYRTIQLQEVRAAPPPRHDDVSQDRLRPQNPQKLADLIGAPAPMPELATDSVRPPAPPDIQAPVSTLLPAKGGPVSSPDRAPWEPRQEILEVTRRVVRDEEAALPRQLTPAIPRVARAPDVVLPIELPSVPLTGQSASSVPSSASGYSLSSPAGLVGGVGGQFGGGTGTPTTTGDGIFPGTTDVFNEKLSDVSTNKAVDKYLDLTMFLFRAPDEGGAGYFELQISRHGETALPVLPKDILFLQDCSESMTPWKLAECKEGLRRWLAKLGPQDRFDILSFRETVSRCFNQFVPLNEDTRRRGLEYIESMRSVGNTDVYASLEAARTVRDDPARPVIAVLVTDGRPTAGVTGSSDIIEGFTRQNKGWVSVFSVGGGKKVNRFLIDLLSYRNRGEALVVPEATDIPAALARWAQELDRPVLSDLSYRLSGYDAADVFPNSLTHLFLDRPLVIYGRIAPGEHTAAIQILGRAGAQQLDMVFPLDAAKALPGTAAIRDRWAWQKVYHLIGTYIQTQNSALLPQIREHASRYHLVVPYGYGEGVPLE